MESYKNLPDVPGGTNQNNGAIIMDTKHGIIRLITVLSVSLALLAVMSAGVWAEEETITEDISFISTNDTEYYDFSYELPGTSDALLSMYIDNYSPSVSKPFMFKATRGNRLSGNNLIIYNELLKQIKEVAAGTRDNTNFTVALDILESDIDLSKNFFDDDLGLESPSYTLENGNIISHDDIIDQGREILKSYLEVDSDLVFKTLLSTCPYELYWAKGGMRSSYVASGYYQYSDGDGNIVDVKGYFKLASPLEFSFYVASDYRAGTDTSINTSLTSAAVSAIENVNAIIDAAATKSDYEKLKFYKEQICDLVTYDNDAAAHLNDPEYTGSPWQIINVFDKIAKTNVVCEGYSKAFQYLCDRTTFYSDTIQCFCPTGTMSGGTGSGPHMWNIVRMDDGKYYVADITNCDDKEEEGKTTVGYPDLLFLKGYTNKVSEDQYEYDCKGITVTYIYDDDSKMLFLPEELAVSPTAYSPIVSHQLSLGGKIGVIFNLGEGVFLNGTPAATLKGKAIDVETSANQIICYVNSIQMAEPITLTFSYTRNDESGSYTGQYSVWDYISAYEALGEEDRDRTTYDLVTALHGYGYNIRNFLELVHGSDKYTYEQMPEVSTVFSLPSMTELNNMRPHLYNNSNRISASYYLRFDSGTDIVITLNGHIEDINFVLINSESYPIENGKIIIQSILPQEFMRRYHIEIVTSNGSSIIEISPLSYIWSVMNSTKYSNVDSAKQAMAALFNYCQTSQTWLDNHN